MRKLLILVVLLTSGVLSIAQTGAYVNYDSTKKRQTVGGYGFEWSNVKFARSAILPDTVKLAQKDSGAIAIHNGAAYLWWDMAWNLIAGPGSPVDTTDRFVNRLVKINDSTFAFCKGATCTSIIIPGSATPTPIDTTDKFVNSVTFPTDSTAIVCKGGSCTTYSIKGGADTGGGGGPSTDDLNDVAARDSSLNHTIIAYSPNLVDTTYYRDSIYHKVGFTNATGLKGKKLWGLRTEKYGLDYSPYGKMGEWNRYITRNWYNASGRPGEVLTRDSYNTNSAGGVILAGEGSWSHVLESDYNGKYEDYVQVTLRGGHSYRPFAMYIGKTDSTNDITFRGSTFHINPAGVASDYLNAKNGKFVIDRVATAPSEVSQTTFIIQNGAKELKISNNTANMLFEGATNYYLFDKSLVFNASITNDLGTASSFVRTIYTKGLVAGYTIVPNANYTQVTADHTIDFRNITADRTLTLMFGVAPGARLEIVTGQALYKVTFTGTYTAKNPDGTACTEIPAGKSCIMMWNSTNTYWQIVSGPAVSSGTVTSFGKTDGYGIISSVATATTTPNHTIRVDTTAIATIAQLQHRIDSLMAAADSLVVDPEHFVISGDTLKTKAKIYTALLTQTDTDAPVATVLENTLGGTVVWSYDSPGNYRATLTGAFASSKTFIICDKFKYNGDDLSGTRYFYCKRNDDDSIRLVSGTAETTPADDILSEYEIEIRVYP